MTIITIEKRDLLIRKNTSHILLLVIIMVGMQNWNPRAGNSCEGERGGGAGREGWGYLHFKAFIMPP